MSSLRDFLASRMQDGLISWAAQLEAADRFGLTVRQAEKEIFELGCMPARYQRNRQSISVSEQRKLYESRVCVIGCGGLGGYVLEELARLGVGQIVAVDFDVFEEHNLNRQLLAVPANLGNSKADAAKERISLINPAVDLTVIKEKFSKENGLHILKESNVAVDALDSISVRLLLSSYCRELFIPFVHGAIGGWFGQVATQFPGEETVEKLYHSCTGDKGMENVYGNPSFTPAVVASLQAAEACKVLLGKGNLLRRRVLTINLLDMELEELEL